MKKGLLLAATLSVALSGCMTIPSFYDDNESLLSSRLRLSVEELNCKQPDIKDIHRSLRHLELYSESKGSSDVIELITPMRETVDGFAKKEKVSETFCNFKKKLLTTQSGTISEALMRRF
jgi:hypothetical protein